MNERRTFVRKIVYVLIMVVLLFPLYALSGKLSVLREDNKLSQADLGEIDPNSEALKLATLGLRPASLVRVLPGVADPALFHVVPAR